MWDVGDNVPNPVLLFFHCAGFCPVNLFLRPASKQKVTGRETWTSCRSFVNSSSSQPTCKRLHVMEFTWANVQFLFNTVRTVCLYSPLSRAAWRVDLRGLRMNVSRNNDTFSSERDVDGRPLLRASVTEPMVRSFEWRFLIVSWRIVAFLTFTARHHLRTATTEFHNSQRAVICAHSETNKRSAIFVANSHTDSVVHCPHYRLANYKFIIRDVYIYYFRHNYLVLQKVQLLFIAYFLPTHLVYRKR